MRVTLLSVCLLLVGLVRPAPAQRIEKTPAQQLVVDAEQQVALAERLRPRAPLEADQLLEKARQNLGEALRLEPAFVRAAQVLGRLLLTLKRSEEAARRLGAIRALVPGDVELALLHGVHLFRLGRTDDGAKLLEGVLKRQPDLFEATYLLAGYYYRSGDLKRALGHAKRTLEGRPKDAKMHGLCGNIHLRQGKLQEAVQAFRRVLELEPSSLVVRVNLGTVFHRLGEYEKAVDVLEKVRDKRPDLALVHHNLGGCYFKLEAFGDAADSYLTFLELEPDHASAHYYAGVSMHRLGRDEEAVPLLVRASALEPTDPWAPYAMAEIALSRGDLTTARTFADAARKRKGDSARILLLSGVVARRQTDYPVAIQTLGAAVKLDPANAPTRAELGFARILAGATDAGIDDLEAARTLDPKEPRVQSWLPVARTRRAVARASAGDSEGAQADLRRALEIRPTLADAAWNLALLQDFVGEPKAGLRTIQAALTFSPADPNLHLAAAFLLLRLGQPEVAQGELQRASGAADVGMRLLTEGGIHGAFREYDAAIAAFKRAAELGIDPGQALTHALFDRAAALLSKGEAARAVVELEKLPQQLAPVEARVRAGLMAIGKLTLDQDHRGVLRLMGLLAAGRVPRGWGLRRLQADKELVYGYLRYRLGESQKATTHLESHVKRFVDDVRGRRVLAVVLAEAAERDHSGRRYAEAAEKAARAAELDPVDPLFRHNLAVVWYTRGEHRRAAEVFRRLRGSIPEATLNLALYLDDVERKGPEALEAYREYVRSGRPAAELARRRIARKERIGGK